AIKGAWGETASGGQPNFPAGPGAVRVGGRLGAPQPRNAGAGWPGPLPEGPEGQGRLKGIFQPMRVSSRPVGRPALPGALKDLFRPPRGRWLCNATPTCKAYPFTLRGG